MKRRDFLQSTAMGFTLPGVLSVAAQTKEPKPELPQAINADVGTKRFDYEREVRCLFANGNGMELQCSFAEDYFIETGFEFGKSYTFQVDQCGKPTQASGMQLRKVEYCFRGRVMEKDVFENVNCYKGQKFTPSNAAKLLEIS